MTLKSNVDSPPFFWVIGGGILQLPLVHEVRRLGVKVIVSDRDPACICAHEADLFLKIDIFDTRDHLEQALRLTSGGVRIAGILTAGIDATVTMAVMARVLGLPGVDPAIAYITNNKNVFRRRLKELGYPVPEFREIAINTIDETDDAVCEIGYPLIVKNTDSSGSRGTRIFYQEDSQGVRKAVRQAITVSRSGYALIEEFWVGREQTVETLFDCEGKFHPCFITDRHFDMSEGFAIETGLRHPTTLPPEVQKEMYDLVEHVARDLGITIGAAKADMILTREGPRIIEMAVRLSGGFDCQFLVPAATGKNVLRAAVLTAMGEPFPDDLLKDTKHRVGLTASLWPGPGRIAAIEGVEEAKKIPGFEHVFFRYQAGDQVEPYIDCTKRVCFIIASGRDEPSARKAMDQVLKTIRIRIDRGIPDA